MLYNALLTSHLILLARATVTPPSGAEVVSSSNVVWNDPNWASDGTGAMPIGNGDVAAGVWVEKETGDLRMHVSKSDVFDENSQPVKIGVLRLKFTPPLWNPSSPAPARNCAANNFTTSPKDQTVIGDQHHQLSVPAGFKCSSPTACPQESADLCCKTKGCVAFSINWAWNPFPELFSTTETNVDGTPGEGWQTWSSANQPPSDTGFTQTLDLATSTVTVSTAAGVSVSVSVDLNAPTRVVNGKRTAHRDAGIVNVAAHSTGPAFSVTASLEPYRVEGKRTSLGRGFCHPRFEHADTIHPAGDTVTWYHYNHLNTSYYNDTLMGQGVDPATPGLNELFTGLAFGGVLSGPAFKAAQGANNLAIAATGVKSAELQLKLLTLSVESPDDWLSAVATVEPASAQASPSDPSTTWAELNERSYIWLTGTDAASNASAKSITDHTNWDRYLALIQGRVAFAPIKFNGQMFNANIKGKGWDARDWGADYWWQNERQPYYNTLAQGDLDTMRAYLDFYLRMLPYVEARTKAQFSKTANPITAGALYPETSTQFGTYNEGDWGCGSPFRKDGASGNTYIRFHWTGSLELSLMALDLYDATGDQADLKKYHPIAAAVVEAFRQRFPNKDKTTGKIDMFPSQALETYQCPNPEDRKNCGTNPSTDIAGLMAVLPRLIATADAAGVPQSQVEVWKQHLSDLPALPKGKASHPQYAQTKVLPMSYHPGRTRNSENTEMYVAHPFRIYGIGKPGLAEGQQTYQERKFRCNDGWCQDIIQAAMLNLTDDAAQQLQQRASARDHGGFRFEGFAGHYQDYEPSLDHYGFMRTGLNYMLMAPLDDDKRSVQLFPAFPVHQWDVAFKLNAPRNTVIEAACKGGKLAYLNVTPPERKADVIVLNCKQ